MTLEPTPQPSMPPTTTHQEDIVVSRQSQISFIWEITQSVIAITITLAVVYLAVAGKASEVVTNSFFLVIGFYYSRTNHQNIGGNGPKSSAEDTYKGR